MVTRRIPKIIINYCYMFYFFLQFIRMSGKNINFGDKKIKTSDFYKNKKALQIDYINVIKC